jgi:hypothetical protein
MYRYGCTARRVANTRWDNQQRNLPARGFKPVYYLIGMHMMMAYGFYKLFYGIREQQYATPKICLFSTVIQNLSHL